MHNQMVTSEIRPIVSRAFCPSPYNLGFGQNASEIIP